MKIVVLLSCILLIEFVSYTFASNFTNRIGFDISKINCLCVNSFPRQKRQTSNSSGRLTTYPSTAGSWYKDGNNCKYFFKSGNTIYLQDSTGFYTKWVTSSDDSGWALADNLIWTWDANGFWFPYKRDEQIDKEIKKAEGCPDKKFSIPITCPNGTCDATVKFPSEGIWTAGPGVQVYTSGNDKYALCDNGFYRKFVSGSPTNDFWTWDFSNGKWYSVTEEDIKDSKKFTCKNEGDNKKEVPSVRANILPRPPRRKFGKPQQGFAEIKQNSNGDQIFLERSELGQTENRSDSDHFGEEVVKYGSADTADNNIENSFSRL